MWRCQNCREGMDAPVETCPECKQPTGIPPNVVYAAAAYEALRERFEACKALCNDKALFSERLTRFMNAVQDRIAVSINMRPESLLSLLVDPKIRYGNLHDHLRADLIIDYDENLLAKRLGVDSFGFGLSGTKLTYGALNLGNMGLISYGEACVILKSDPDITCRISFLEENSFSYAHGNSPPFAFDAGMASRALWETVSLLAFVKHSQDLLNNEIGKSQLPDLVLSSAGDKRTDRFIEAQIFPPITLNHIAKIRYTPSHHGQGDSGPDPLVDQAEDIYKELLEEPLRLRSQGYGIPFEVV